MPGRRPWSTADADRRVAGGQPQGRARLHAGRAHPAAIRRCRREPDLDPRLGPAQQLPPARRQRPDRRLPLRQRRRLQRLRVAGAADHQAHRGLQGRQRARASAATRSAAPSTSSPRRATTPGSSRSAARRARSASSRTTSAPARCTVPRLLRRFDRHRAGRLPRPRRAGRGAAPTAPSATRCRAAPRSASTSASSDNDEELPGALTQQELDRNPQAARPDLRASSRAGAQLRLHARRLHRSAPRSARTRCSSGRRSSTTRIWTIRCRSRSSTTRPTAGRSELRWTLATPALRSTAIAFRRAAVRRHAPERRPVRRTCSGTAGCRSEEPDQQASNYRASTPRTSSTSPRASRSCAAARGQYADARACATSFRRQRQPVRLGRLPRRCRRRLGFLWRVRARRAGLRQRQPAPTSRR